MRSTQMLLVVLALSIGPICSASISGVAGGTAAPGPTLGPYFMIPFPDESRTMWVSDVDSPLEGENPPPEGKVSFSTLLPVPGTNPPEFQYSPLSLRINNPSNWTATEHVYTGKIYFTLTTPYPPSMRLTLPSDTAAFYFYATTNDTSPRSLTATASGASLTQEMPALGGASYYGFYADPGESLTTIDLNSDYGFILGAFGIAKRDYPPDSVIVTDQQTGATISFETVTQSGQTTVTTSEPQEAQGPPDGFMVGAPPTIFDISTTAVFAGQIIIGIDYSQMNFVNESALRLFHFDEVDGVWADITTSLDMANDMIYGTVSSLSPFAVFEPTIPNRAPEADAGPDQTVECVCQGEFGTLVTLYGSGSSDPDPGDTLTYTWTGPFLEGGGTAHGETPTVTLDGCQQSSCVITLIVNDGTVDSEPDTVLITVQDTTPPDMTEPGDTTVEAMGPDGVPIDDDEIQTFLDGVDADDDCTPKEQISITNDAPEVFLPGDTLVTFTAEDASGNSATRSSTVTVVEAAESHVSIVPRVINREGRLQRILAVIRFPEGTAEEDIDKDVPLVLYPGDSPDGIEATHQRIVTWQRWGTLRVCILGFFTKDDVTAAVPEDSWVEFTVVGRFVDGQYFYGTHTVKIVSWIWKCW